MISKMIALDWRGMKYYQIRGLLLPLFAFFAGVIYSPILVIPMSVFFVTSFSINPFAVEEKGELNHLYLTLPIGRKQIVMGRYSLSLLMTLAGIVIGIPTMLLSNTIAFSRYYVGVKGVISIVAMSILMYAILNVFMFPTLFKLGYQRGKTWGFYLPIILFSIVVGVTYAITLFTGNETFTIDFIVFISEHLMLVSGVCVLVSVALLSLSYFLSVKVYSKRNF